MVGIKPPKNFGEPQNGLKIKAFSRIWGTTPDQMLNFGNRASGMAGAGEIWKSCFFEGFREFLSLSFLAESLASRLQRGEITKIYFLRPIDEGYL
jgi:hypothetical protein